MPRHECQAVSAKRIHLANILNDELFRFNVLLGKEPPGMHPAAPKTQILCAPLHSAGSLVQGGEGRGRVGVGGSGFMFFRVRWVGCHRGDFRTRSGKQCFIDTRLVHGLAWTCTMHTPCDAVPRESKT